MLNKIFTILASAFTVATLAFSSTASIAAGGSEEATTPANTQELQDSSNTLPSNSNEPTSNPTETGKNTPSNSPSSSLGSSSYQPTNSNYNSGNYGSDNQPSQRIVKSNYVQPQYAQQSCGTNIYANLAQPTTSSEETSLTGTFTLGFSYSFSKCENREKMNCVNARRDALNQFIISLTQGGKENIFNRQKDIESLLNTVCKV
jgi:hypothetical protein